MDLIHMALYDWAAKFGYVVSTFLPNSFEKDICRLIPRNDTPSIIPLELAVSIPALPRLEYFPLCPTALYPDQTSTRRYSSSKGSRLLLAPPFYKY